MILHKFLDAYIIDKPAGLATHTPDGGVTDGMIELASRLLSQPLWAVHRLDKETSGCLLVTSTSEAVEKWSKKLQEGSKKYFFISPHEHKQSVWSFEACIEKIKPHHFGIVKGPANSFTKFAKLGKTKLGFLYEAEIFSGKTHQIRIHAQASGVPILGDYEHGGDEFIRLMLHARYLEIDDKVIESPLPEIFNFDRAKQGQDLAKFIISLDRRRFLLKNSSTNAFRLVHREWTYLKKPKLCVEKLDSVLQFLQYTENDLDQNLIEAIANLTQSQNWFVRKMHNRGQSSSQETNENIILTSPNMPRRWTVTENKMHFELRLEQGLSSGLFLDQRENRNKVLHESQGKSVANLFSYTCGFSVAAALGGAHEVVSVDTSRQTLDWGKDGFRLNNLDPDKYEFFVADSIFFLKSCQKRGRLFDTIIIDPPTFSRHKLGSFSLKKDLGSLLELAFSCLKPHGEFLITMNDETMTSGALARMIEDANGRSVQKAIEIKKIHPPCDFEFPLERETVLKGFWVKIL